MMHQIRTYLTLVFLSLGTLFYSCSTEKETLDTAPSKALTFSADTFFFDTVFTDLKTVTLRMRLYNPNDKAVNIKSAYVNGVNGSYPFSFYINGRLGPNRINDIRVEGKDSAYILLSAKFDPRNQDLPFIIKDSLVFEVEGRNTKQDVKILAYGQDALYLRNRYVTCDTVWKNDRPIILLDTVSVKRGCTLTIEKGTRVYGYNAAFLIVRGTLIVKGELDDKVTFQGTRLENYYSDVPGQWGGILIMDGGIGLINNALIKNSYRGIQVGEVGPKPAGVLENAALKITNSYVQNIVDYGILGVKGIVTAINNQIVDCGESGFAGLQGGYYELWHNTFGQSGNNNYRRDGKYQLAFADNLPDSRTQTLYGGSLHVKAVNNIVHGSEEDEIAFGKQEVPDTPFDTLFFNNLIRSKQAAYFKESNANKGNQLLPTNFKFLSPFKYDLAPDTLGAPVLFGSGLPLDTVRGLFPSFVSNVELRNILSKDILGKPRPVQPGIKPDPGAYNNRKQQ